MAPGSVLASRRSRCPRPVDGWNPKLTRERLLELRDMAASGVLRAVIDRCYPTMRKSPQEKKRLSLLKDRRNTYGEHSKGSRKASRVTSESAVALRDVFGINRSDRPLVPSMPRLRTKLKVNALPRPSLTGRKSQTRR